MTNLILNTDSYKFSHPYQYPKGTRKISSYIEARGGATESMFFGLQAFLKEYLLKPVTREDIEEAKDYLFDHGEPFYEDLWLKLINKHGGYLPLAIEAVPEGTVMRTSNVQVQVVNTDDEFWWLPSHIETSLLRAVWYPSTVATISKQMKDEISRYLRLTSSVPVEDQIMFKLHDFGARGASSKETEMLGGMSHLVNFMGTDTVGSLIAASKYYYANTAGYSIPASEHSTITSWGMNREVNAYENMIDLFSGDGKLYACVSDSYDIYNAVNNLWGEELKEKIIKSGGTLVIRPDSGDPLTVPLEIVKMLMEKFGYTVNSKGYTVLPPYISVIQGDGITAQSLPIILENFRRAGVSTENIAFGMGGGLLQKVDRDTLKYAMKASAIMDENGIWHDVFKDPIHGGKKSKKGRLGLIYEHGIGSGNYRTVSEDFANKLGNHLEVVWSNGQLLRDETFANIRKRSETFSRNSW